MTQRYRAAFFIPRQAAKTLTDSGWEFHTVNRLPEEVVDFLTKDLGLIFAEQYLNMARYAKDDIKATVVRDANGNIEHVYFQLFGGGQNSLESVLRDAPLLNSVELFIPHGVR
jgi:hypothetical protein